MQSQIIQITSKGAGMEDKKTKNFKEIMDKIFYMQGFAEWVVEDYRYAKDNSKIKRKWAEKAVLLISVLGGEERALQILNIIKE